VWVTRAAPPGAEAPVRRVELAAPERGRSARQSRRHQVELNTLTVVLVMIVVTATAAVWLHGRSEAPAAGGGAAGGQAMTGRTSGAELIRAENARPGSPEWTIPDGDARPRGVEAFADDVSGERGDTVRLYVSTAAEGFEAIAYRLGHYDGVGAREVWRSGTQPALDQPDCRVDDDTRMVDCSNWSPSLTVPVGTEWTPGQYLFKLVPTEGSASYVPYVVRDDIRASDVLVISDVTTLQARNTWGGHSLYDATGQGAGDSESDGDGERATVVSFDRPMDLGWGQSGTLGDSANIGQLVESLGLDVTYATNLDQHLTPEIMRGHKVVVTGARDEHYSAEMREGLEAARDDGVNIVFLGGDAVRRRIRLEPSALGEARHQVGYRSAETDPLAELAPEKVTTDWSDPPAASHERSLTGAAHECGEAGLRADMVIVEPEAWMFAGTNVTAGQRWPEAITDSFDRVAPGGSTPGNVQVLAHSPVSCDGDTTYADLSYYTAPSGAGVLEMGTLGVEPRLGPLCPAARLTAQDWNCQLRQMVGNVVTTFAEGPAGVAHPAEPNLDELE
jgi:hypothetical protein